MTITEVSKLSVPEKLKLMEALWEDLRGHPELVDFPEWHRSELQKTKDRRERGLEEPISLEEARALLLKK